MNGRIYDAKLGRFLQADPFIQAASNTQSYNRYSYVMNNPLNATDPSGFFLKSLWNEIRPFVGVIVGVVLAYFCGPCSSSVWGAMGAGAAAGAAGAAANGGNILRGAFTGAIGGAVFYGIGTQFTGAAEGGFGHVMVHATAGGVLSVLQGGKFGHGFISAGLTKAANISRIMANDASGFADAIRTTIAAIVGGTISEITGGKFANGATTAALAQALNGNAEIQRKVDIQESLRDRFSRIVKDVRSKHFSDSIPSDHEIGLVLDLTAGGEMITSPDGSSITVSPEIFDMLDENTIAWIVGHELVHVSDVLKSGGHIAPGSIMRDQSEINARVWQLDNASEFGIHLSPKMKVDIMWEIDDFKRSIRTKTAVQKLMEEM